MIKEILLYNFGGGMNFSRQLLNVLIIGIVTIALAGMLLTGCFSQDDYEEINLDDRVSDAELGEIVTGTDTDVLTFGFDLRASPQEDARQYLPFLHYLEEATGYTFELRFTPKDGQIVDDLGMGMVQFAFIGAGSCMRVHIKYGVIPIVRGLNSQGKAEYRSVIVVAPDSSIQTIEDLRGKSFAFGSITSTQGHLIPRIILRKHGLTLNDLIAYEYTGSHRNCANAVNAGRCDAGGMQDTIGEEMAAAGLLRIIYISQYYPSSGIAANKDVSPEVLAKVQQTLLDFDPLGRDAPGLYHWDRTEMPNGFSVAKDEDYAELLEWAMKLDFFAEEE